MEPSHNYRIGQVAERTGVSVETLRYYEKRRLLHAPARTQGGFRVYSGAVVVDQDRLPETDVRRGYPTPTLLVADRDIFGMSVPKPPLPDPT